MIESLSSPHPDNSKAWFGRSVILSELESYEEALSACDKSIELGNQAATVFLNRDKALLALNHWDEGILALDNALNRFDNVDELKSRDTEGIIRNLLCRTQEAGTWRSCLETLIEVYDKHQFTSFLGQELVRSIRTLFSPLISVPAAGRWRDIWQELTYDRFEFQTPLRLLNTAVCYRENKGDPRVLLELSAEEQNLFQSLLGVEKPLNQLNEAEFIWEAGYMALTIYEFQGRGVVWFEGEKPRYLPRRDDMPDQLLALVDEYDPEKEFLVIPSNHSSVLLVELADIRLDPKEGKETIPEEEYKQELEAILTQLREKGLDPLQVERLRSMTLAYRNGEFSLAGYSPEMIKILQILYEEGSAGNIQAIVDFYKRYL